MSLRFLESPAQYCRVFCRRQEQDAGDPGQTPHSETEVPGKRKKYDKLIAQTNEYLNTINAKINRGKAVPMAILLSPPAKPTNLSEQHGFSWEEKQRVR